MNIRGTQIWIILLELLKILVILAHLKMGRENLISVSCVSSQAERMTYSREFLVRIGKHVEDKRITVRLTGNTCACIRSLGIRKKTSSRRRKRAGKKRNSEERKKVNHSNLVNIKTLHAYHIVKNLSVEHVSLIISNIRSIKHKHTELAEYLVKNKSDCAIITESWLNNTDEDREWCNANSITQVGFNIISCPRQIDKRGGGICLIHKNDSLKVELMEEKDLTFWQYALFRVTTMKKEHFSILAVYHPPSNTCKGYSNTNFVDDLVEKYAEISAQFGPGIMIMGDLNMHMEEASDQEVSAFLLDLDIMGLKQHVDFYTHRHGHVLDVIISDCNTSDTAIYACAPGEFLSDHRAIHCVLSIQKDCSYLRKRIKKVDTTDLDVYEFRRQADLGAIHGEDVNQLWDQFVERATSTLSELTSTSEITITLRPKVPWMNTEVRAQKAIVRSREKIWKKYGDDHHWQALQRERKRYRSIINHHRTNAMTQKVLDCHKDSKKLYALVTNMTGTKVNNPMPDSTSDTDLANEFAKYFTDKIDKIREEQKVLPLFDTTMIRKNSAESIQKWNTPSLDYLRNVVKSMKNKQCDLDIIPTSLIKEDALDESDDYLSICEFLVNIITLSFNTGTFPDDWKCAQVKPLLKNKNLDLIPKNYRPVSNLNFISKVTERIVLNQLQHHCDTNDLFPSYQSAYRRHHSCETALVAITNSILWAMERGECVHLVALDLSAAFDTVHRSLLHHVLENRFNITDQALQWMDSYLGPRGFRVKIGECESEYTPLETGVAQGSCLGPVLFSCYASTLETIIPEKIEIFGFADDHTLDNTFKPQKSEFSSISLLESTLRNIHNWMGENRLKMNNSKTEFITFGSRQQLQKCECELLNVCGDIIKSQPVMKYLGANLDENLNFTNFVSNKCKKAMANLKRIQRIRKCLTKDTANQLILSLVVTHLDYANAILYGTSESNLRRMQRIQNIAAKVVCDRMGYMESARACLRELHWLPIRARIEFKILVLVYTSLKGLAPLYLTEILKLKQINAINLRSNSDNLLCVPLIRKQTFAARSLSHAGPTLWNNLSRDIRYSMDIDDFKKQLKTYLFRKYLLD